MANYEMTVDVSLKGAKQTKKQIDDIAKSSKKLADQTKKAAKDSEQSFGDLQGGLGKLAGAFGVAFSAAAVVNFVKNVTEGQRVLHNMASRSGNAAKELKGLQLAYESVGYSAEQANAVIEDATRSFAKYKFSGQLTGTAQILQQMGISLMGKDGQMRSVKDALLEAGDYALEKTKKNGKVDRASAQQFLMDRGLSTDMADFVTRANIRKTIEAKEKEAIVSKEVAERSEKLHESWSSLKESLVDLLINGLKLDKIMNGVATATKAMSKAFREYSKVFDMVGTMASNAFDKIIDFLVSLGVIDKPADKATASAPTDGAVATGSTAGKKGYQTPTSGSFDDRLVSHIKQHEGFSATAYSDGKGRYSVGYGHNGVAAGTRVTREQAEALLRQDMRSHVDPAKRIYANYSPKIQALAADLAYNAGVGRIQKGSKFWNLVNSQGDISEAQYASLYTTAWDEKQGRRRVFDSLIKRRHDAYRMAQGMTTTTNETTVVINAPTGNANDIAKTFKESQGTVASLQNAGLQPPRVG